MGHLRRNTEPNGRRFLLDARTRIRIVRVMAHITTSVEYAIHCLLWLAVRDDPALSSRDLAELQGVSPTFLAKILPKLERAGIVSAHEGVRGGYRLARPAERITFLDIVDAIEGEKPLFDCQEVRRRCALYGDCPPRWASGGVCAIHGVMLQAEKAMRLSLASQSLGDIAKRFSRIAPAKFFDELDGWVDQRMSDRIVRGNKSDNR